MKKVIAFVMLFILVITIIPFANIEVNALTSGELGDNIKWEYDDATNTLTVSGEGDIPRYNAYQSFGGNCIKTIIITEGVTSISSRLFGICEQVTSISIPVSIIKIDENAFENCSSLKNVYYSGTREQWNKIEISTVGNDYLLSATINFKQESHKCSFGDWIIINEPTCVDEGRKIRKCSCGNDETLVIPATGIHNYEWKVTIAPTCTENGKQMQYCTVCNFTGESISIYKLGHKSGDWTVETKPTCSLKGLEVQNCEICGCVLNSREITQLLHEFTDWKVSLKPTEITKGKETRKCKLCDYVEERPIDKLPNKNGSDKLIGDADGNGKITATDARLVLQVVAGLKNKTELIFENSDVNNDNQISATDARKILQIVAGLN